MKNWKKFEKEVLKEIKQLVLQVGCRAELIGGADSTVSDILVTSPTSKEYFLEIKMPEAQSGQFVIEKENLNFVFSKKIKYKEDKFQKEIIKIVNESADIKNVDIPINVLSGAIKLHYERKKTKFFATKKEKIIIIPIDKIEEYFDLGVSIRFKKSGSRNISKEDFNRFKENKKLNDKYKVEFVKDKIYFYGKYQSKYIYEGYFLSEVEEGKYQLKKLSNTKNLTVVYLLSLKSNHPESRVNDFLKLLK